MDKDFAYCKGRFWESNKVEMTNCPMRKTCKRHILVVGDNHFVVSSIPPEHDYICWVNSRECAKKDYVLYLKDDKEN